MSIQLKLQNLVTKWRTAHPERQFPCFDHQVTSLPHTLIFLESPGPEVANSGVVSPSNKDGTAEELTRLIELAFDSKEKAGVLCWNAIPWFINRPPRVADVKEARALHEELLAEVRPGLRFVLLLGAKARALLPFLSLHVGTAHIYGGHHPGRQAQIQQGLITENEALFRLLREKHTR